MFMSHFLKKIRIIAQHDVSYWRLIANKESSSKEYTL